MPLPSTVAWLVVLASTAGMLAQMASKGPPGWIAALPLLVVLVYLVRRSARAHALSSMLILGYIGYGLVFRESQGALLLAWLGALHFLACVAFVRFSAVERRRALARQQATTGTEST